MTVTIDGIDDAGAMAQVVRYSSDVTDAIFSLFLGGVAIGTTRQKSILVNLADGAKTLEVRDDQVGPGAPAAGEPLNQPATAAEAEVELRWPRVTGAMAYKIEESVSSVWTHRATVRDEQAGDIGGSGASDLSHRTTPLADSTAVSFRITSIGTDGNEGTPTSLTVTAVRHPDPPDVTYVYSDSTNKITLTEIV